MKGYLKNGKIIFRHSYFDNRANIHKTINFSTGIAVSNWKQKEQEAQPPFANYKVSEHKSRILRLINSYPYYELKKKYDEWKKITNFIQEDLQKKWYYKLSDAYRDYYDTYHKVKSIRKVKEHHRNWIEKFYPETALIMVNMEWYNDYMNKIIHLSDNTRRDHVKILKRVLREARRNGYDNFKLNEDELRNPPAKKKEVVWLELNELRELAKVKPATITEQKVLNCWLFRAYTGLRHTEMNQVDIKKIKDSFITIYDTKKKKEKEIEVPDLALKILKRNKGKLPIVPQQKENELIKKIARSGKLKRLVYTSLVKKKEYQLGEFELWETLTTHTARRTFASLCYREFNLTLEEVRELIQHTNTTQTLDYIGATLRKPKIRNMF